MVAMIS